MLLDVHFRGIGSLELKHKIHARSSNDPVILGCPKFESRPWQFLSDSIP